MHDPEELLRGLYDSMQLMRGIVEIPADDSDIIHLYDSPATKGLATLHGGQVTALSEGRGHGATFHLRIPVSTVMSEDDAEKEAAPAATGLRILVVEDNHDAAQTLGELLEMVGHEVQIVYDGASAIAAARTFRQHAVVCDLGLPGALDGYAVARVVRQEMPGTRLIAISGYANEEARSRSREAGFSAISRSPRISPRLNGCCARCRRFEDDRRGRSGDGALPWASSRDGLEAHRRP